MPQFPSLKARELRRVLEREPLGYTAETSSGGSHTLLTSENGFPDLRWAFHDRQTISPGLVRTILVKQVGMSAEEAVGLL
jgi:predicted RNA binding protein YcfA (HicA-like mRNA interferase family)